MLNIMRELWLWELASDLGFDKFYNYPLNLLEIARTQVDETHEQLIRPRSYASA